MKAKFVSKFVEPEEIYNFVVDDFFIWNYLKSTNYVLSSRSFEIQMFELFKWPQMEIQPKQKL
jgi:hypothetical protein